MTKMFYFKQNEPKIVANAIYKPVIKDIAIIATLGKNGWTQIKDFYDAGATIFRINGSHIKSKEDMEKMLDGAKDVMPLCEKGSLMYDTQGPEIRTRIIEKAKKNAAYNIKVGDKIIVHTNLDDKEIVFTKDPARVKFVGKTIHIGVNYDKFVDDAFVGNYLTIESRLVDAKINAVDKEKGTVELLITKVNTDNEEYSLTDRRHINLYGAPVSQPTLTDADKEYIKMFVKEGGKYIALSFTRSEDDINDVRALVKQAFVESGLSAEEAENRALEVSIIAKFETRQGLENIYSIMNLADGAMVARGDLSSEIPAEDVPYAKELIIKVCKEEQVHSASLID
jgi:pyruvate kinase